ncbi:hypothetical protein [Sphingopyxis sp. PET50]|uniref:hypothetical protein n=1 Tax=Sphingopyxis sp. PET50 TaxID=2976533 RepID=UPI0021AF3155|nr:hypothetical protein [Sphingopyxis sp. PET50]
MIAVAAARREHRAERADGLVEPDDFLPLSFDVAIFGVIVLRRVKGADTLQRAQVHGGLGIGREARRRRPGARLDLDEGVAFPVLLRTVIEIERFGQHLPDRLDLGLARGAIGLHRHRAGRNRPGRSRRQQRGRHPYPHKCPTLRSDPLPGLAAFAPPRHN